MNKTLSKSIQSYAIYSVLFLLYLAVFIFVGFFLHSYINRWTLITAFVSYITIGFVYLIIKRADKGKLLLFLAGALITPLIFLLLATTFGHTYDTSYDGQDYQQTAVIELANKWNPIYEKSPPIKVTNRVDEPVITGYGKIVWSIDSSIYKLTNNIDSAALINLVVALLAFLFAFLALIKIGIGAYSSAIVAFLAIVPTVYVEQLFTLREDAISYEFLVIGISSLVLILKDSNKLAYFMCLLTAFIFLAGIKDSNLFLFLLLLVLSIYIIFKKKLYGLKSLKITIFLGLIFGFVTLFNPYLTNIVRYHSVDYPFNQKSFSTLLRTNGVPVNIKNDSRLKLFYYGIYSSAVTGDAQNKASNASLKIPFTFSANELLAEGSAPAKFVGGYGVLFSGIFSASIVIYLYLVFKRKSKTEIRIFIYLSLALCLIIITCLLSPIPSYSRYGIQLVLFPISIILALLLMAGKKMGLVRLLATVLITLTAYNIGLDIIIASAIDAHEFTTINSQLSDLKRSNKPYLVYANTFYSNYIKLRSYGVNIQISPKPLNCIHPIVLDNSLGSTHLCRT